MKRRGAPAALVAFAAGVAAAAAATGPAAAAEAFRAGCAEVGIPEPSRGAVTCVGWCNETQATAVCVAASDGPGEQGEGREPLAGLAGRARLLVRDGAGSRATVASFAAALGRATAWSVVLRGVDPGAEIVPLRRRGTWYDVLARPLALRGPGRLTIEADGIARRFTIAPDE